MALAAWLLVYITLIWLAVASTRIFIFTKRAEKLINQVVPYEQAGNGSLDILVVGDSIAYGTGSSSAETTIAGLIGAKFPQANITNKAKNGTKTKTLANRISGDIDRNYRIVIIIVGANDIIHPEVNLGESEQYLGRIYAEASEKADNVIAITTGDFKHISFFLYPLNYYFGDRSRSLSESALWQSAKYNNVHYVDTFTDKNSPGRPQALEAADHLHLSDLGSHYWVQEILSATNNLEF